MMPSKISSPLLCLVTFAIHLSSAEAAASIPTTSIDTPVSNGSIASTNNATVGAAPAGQSVIGLTGSSGNTGCFAYFNQKDSCASPSTTNNCRPKVSTVVVQQFVMSSMPRAGPISPSAPINRVQANLNASNTGVVENDPTSSGGNNTVSIPPSGAVPLSNQNTPLNRRQDGPWAYAPPSTLLNTTSSPFMAGSSATAINSTLPVGIQLNATSAQMNTTSLPFAQMPTDGKTTASPPTVTVTTSNSSSSPGGICGIYDSENEPGVCIWSGSDATGLERNKSGWVSTSAQENCKKEVILQRTGSTSAPIVARVLEGCSFDTSIPSVGCSQIYLTKKAFMALNPSPQEISAGVLKDSITWDFNSKSKPEAAAV